MNKPYEGSASTLSTRHLRGASPVNSNKAARLLLIRNSEPVSPVSISIEAVSKNLLRIVAPTNDPVNGTRIFDALAGAYFNAIHSLKPALLAVYAASFEPC
jgi:hypothetical protein